MDPGSNPDVRPEEEPGSLLALALLALIAGGVSGLICAGFRLALEEADRLLDRTIAEAHDGGLVGSLLVTCGAGPSKVVLPTARRAYGKTSLNFF